jgi:Zn-dependent protease with chaperone function
VHTLLGLTSVFLVVLGGYLTLGLLRRLGGWWQRRDLQLLVLAAPVVSLGLAVGGLHHFAGQICFLGTPPWDYAIGVALPLVMGLVALGGLWLGLLRLALMARLVARKGTPGGSELQALANRLSERLGTSPTRVLVIPYDRPLALTCGLFRSTLLVSTWILDRLDPQELESVLAHELGHVARHDYPLVWIATVLRDAFFYLPTSRTAYRQLQREKELACDDLAVGATQRPLALASALAKVWGRSLGGPTFGLAQRLVQTGEAVERRIERLLTAPPGAIGKPRMRPVGLGLGASAAIGLLTLEAANLALILAPMGCGPASVLANIF